MTAYISPVNTEKGKFYHSLHINLFPIVHDLLRHTGWFVVTITDKVAITIIKMFINIFCWFPLLFKLLNFRHSSGNSSLPSWHCNVLSQWNTSGIQCLWLLQTKVVSLHTDMSKLSGSTGQTMILHWFSSRGNPSHCLPFEDGSGAKHKRVRVLVPPPHILVQSLHAVHIVQPPSTGHDIFVQHSTIILYV